MERLEFKDYEELAYTISDEYNSLDDEYGDVSVIAKYNEAKEIIRELASIGYSIEGIELHRPEWDNYESEYSISLNFDGIWCSPMKYDDRYITEESETIYIMDNCSSTVISHCKGNEMYEVSVGDEITDKEGYNDEEDTESKHKYTVNGKMVDKETFDNYVSNFAPDKVDKE